MGVKGRDATLAVGPLAIQDGLVLHDPLLGQLKIAVQRRVGTDLDNDWVIRRILDSSKEKLYLVLGYEILKAVLVG